ncbi:xanthine dehydrogenase family protein molybdopterin-binding subunit [Pseudoduganella umbonata]|uniref:Xanthine dehydrogenase YagR molybdenum-binding subunit n=1 Tax=Pseudoduganella umbonata TaxID=864828 RepID=A0A4P8HTI2_9BURK|nr:xanthine dehydrogenase family protein molybdopterin-binding subunit [Pseudoduganella umbonata]MBB3220841.1 xanthine dehydrogenase YagR molybdenum-binding subunit [Pseudoduganella umbonata]QCP11695.1 xanthine dehydrogenase family protein molybdopterin-binding subunit [Pseudoduganella umbonata]
MTDLIEALQAPTADRGTGAVRTGTPVSRVDGRAKVTGQAKYAAEHPAPDLAYGVVVSSPAAKGRIVSIDTRAALAVAGVVEVLTHKNRPKIRSFDIAYKDMTAPAGSPFRPLYDDHVMYSGQPLALVVAETFEAARYAASLVTFEIAAEPHGTKLSANLDRAYKPKPLKAGFEPPPDEKGDTDAAFDAAPVKIDAEFYSGVEHHNPMELFASTVIRGEDGHLTIYDKTQSSQNSRWYVSHVFGLSKNKVTVRNTYVGGAFGSGLRPQYQLTLAVMAALHLKRSVRVVLTRQQMFTFGHRPETVQRVKLAAERDGTLRAIWHQAIAETSPIEDYVEVVVNWSGLLYACDNIKLDYKLVKLDQYTPIDMRAPGAAHGVHALEVAMDELAYALKMDPLALRLKNYAERVPIEDKPYSSKELRACYELGAKQFGWDQRPLEPRSRREGTELVGWGMATGVWDAMQMFARASAVLHADGKLVVSSAATDIGTGTYTVMAMIAAEAMGLPLEDVTFQLGDSTLPVAPIEGGSSHVTTVGSAVAGVCEKLQKTLFKHAQKLRGSPFADVKLKDVEFVGGTLRLKHRQEAALPLSAIMNDSGLVKLEEKYLMLPNMLKQRKFRRLVHSAVFVEVRVDEQTGMVRVTRVTSAIAAGRIMNTKTATSQITGGIVWGISQALHEESYADHRLGRFMNHNYAEYHVPVNADIHAMDVIFVEEDDRIVSRLGAKGVGEIGLVGVAAAISNAIWHATGKRLRSTPMTPDKVLGGGP